MKANRLSQLSAVSIVVLSGVVDPH